MSAGAGRGRRRATSDRPGGSSCELSLRGRSPTSSSVDSRDGREPWTPLILRDVFIGTRRFDEIQNDLGISRKVLTERLNHLVERGVLERRPYDQRPRHEYVLTDKGTELIDLLMIMVAWGDRWLAGAAGPPVLYRHHACGEISRVDLRCASCGEPMRAGDVDVLPGPGIAS